MPLPTAVSETLDDAIDAAKRPVRVPRRAPLEGFVLGFLAALLPASLVALALPTGRGVTVLVLATVLALAGAVVNTARELRS